MGAQVSVIIPAYNAERTVERAIRSVFASTIPIDVWAVNDGSTDSTGAILDRLALEQFTQSEGCSILHVIHQVNCGAYQARLNALKLIQTPYFGFVDADDAVEPDMFEKMLSFAEHERLDVVQVKHDGKKIVLDAKNVILVGDEIWTNVVRPIIWKGQCSSFIWDKLYRSQYDFSEFDPTDYVTNWDDLIFNLQFFVRVNRFGLLDEPLYHYAETAGSAARKFRWRLVHDFCETMRMRRKMAKAYNVCPWGWYNLRWAVKNARNIFLIFVKSALSVGRRN